MAYIPFSLHCEALLWPRSGSTRKHSKSLPGYRVQCCRNCSSPRHIMGTAAVQRCKGFLSYRKCSVLRLAVCPQSWAANLSGKPEKLITVRKHFPSCLQLIGFLNTLQQKAGSILNPRKAKQHPQTHKQKLSLSFRPVTQKAARTQRKIVQLLEHLLGQDYCTAPWLILPFVNVAHHLI